MRRTITIEMPEGDDVKELKLLVDLVQKLGLIYEIKLLQDGEEIGDDD
jgi:hypothetical protein